MSNCKHLRRVTGNGRSLSHSPRTEGQILHALQMSDDELRDWILRATQRFSLMRAETFVFLLLHYRRVNSPVLVEELAAGLEVRMRAQIVQWYVNGLGHRRTEDLSSEVCSQAWTILLESPHGRGIWMQICFDRFIRSLCRDVLRKKGASDILSYDSNSEIRSLALSVSSAGPSAEEMVYLREVLSQLEPRQRQVFLMQRGLNERQRTIASAVHRSERSVRTLLKEAERQLQAAC
jgi:DNA-directed RNA polymerase specialized sigma24 family protein